MIEASLFDSAANLIRRFPLKPPLPKYIKIIHHIPPEYEGEEEQTEYWTFKLECFTSEFALYVSDEHIKHN